MGVPATQLALGQISSQKFGFLCQLSPHQELHFINHPIIVDI
jgi:hypothetical protein